MRQTGTSGICFYPLTLGMNKALMNVPTQSFVMPDGGRLTIPADDRLMTPYVLKEQGDWFEDEIRFVRCWLRPGMHVVDVGANYGVYTCAAASAVGPSGHVWSFEPAGLPHSCLAHSITDNAWSQVTLQQVALSDHQGTARLGINANAELNSLSQSDGIGEEVLLSTLNEQTARFTNPIDFLKLDAEGEEIRILSAANEFFECHDPLVMFEYRHGNLVNTGLIDAMRVHHMEIYRLIPGLGCLAPLESNCPADDFLLNLFGCRSNRSKQLATAGFLVLPQPAEVDQISLAEAQSIVNKWIIARPWAKTLWPDSLPTQRSNGQDLHICGLAELILAEEKNRPIAERLVRLIRAEKLLSQALKLRSSVARGFALARAQAALGFRSASLRTLLTIDQIFTQRKTALGYRLDEATMPPDARHDELIAVGHDPGVVIMAMLDEPTLERCAFSSYFAGAQIMPLLQRVARNPLVTEVMRRRISAINKG